MMIGTMQAGCFAAAIACFWRKDFEKSDLLPVAIMGMASLCTSKFFLLAAWPSSEVMAYLAKLPWGRVSVGARKNWLMVAVHVFFHVLHAHLHLTFAHFGLIASVAAGIQLVRRPVALKAKLRSVRIATGPLYMFSAIGAFQRKLEAGCVTGSFALAAIAMCSLAAVLMRPDNHALDFVLSTLLIKTPGFARKLLQKKALCHGILMVASLTILTWLLWREGCFFAFMLNVLSLLLELSRRQSR